jgi:hypothetical protein
MKKVQALNSGSEHFLVHEPDGNTFAQQDRPLASSVPRLIVAVEFVVDWEIDRKCALTAN